MRDAWLALACALLAAGPAALAQPQEGATGIAFSGHYKNMLLHSRTVFGADERYWLDANRLRLEWKGQLRPGVRIEVQYDNEVLLGDYFRTAQSRLESLLPRRTYWDLEGVYARGDDAVGRHRLRRGSVTLSQGTADIRLGRQRVAWGTGRFWSPLDLLNPVSPTALEPGERDGVDAVLVEHKRSAVSRASLVFAPVHAQRDYRLVQWHDNVRAVDFSITAGQVPEGSMLGIDVAGQVGGAGVRAEWTVTKVRNGGTPHRILLGWDYAFANTLALTAELFHDGNGASDPSGYDLAGLLSGRRQTVARRYAGLYASYDLTPLLKTQNWLVGNLDDRSWYLSPRLVYSASGNLELTAGIQLFGGKVESEFGRRHRLFFLSLQRFF